MFNSVIKTLPLKHVLTVLRLSSERHTSISEYKTLSTVKTLK